MRRTLALLGAMLLLAACDAIAKPSGSVPATGNPPTSNPTTSKPVRPPDATWPVTPELQPPAIAVIPDAFGPATWALNPAFPAPNAATADLQVLVSEQACASGSPTTGRMSAPVIRYEVASVTITIGVLPLPGAQECPGAPGTPATIRLAEPLGDRALLDGGRVPPAPPKGPFD